jgi:2-methylcitrate dehydratase PrpD
MSDAKVYEYTKRLAFWVATNTQNESRKRALIAARQAVLDWCAVTIAGASDEAVGILNKLVDDAGDGSASLLGQSKRAAPMWAVLTNGTAGHVLDYDDVNEVMTGHPTAVILPALLTLAEIENSSAQDLLNALVTGHEVASALGAAIGPGHYQMGFHSTATLGAIAAACSCASLLKLNAAQTEQAIGIAATQAAGLKSMFGTMTKSLQVGRAAQSGYLAAQLAARGFTANADALETEQGFFLTHGQSASTMGGGFTAPREPAILNTLFKFHAACYLTHSTIDAVADILAAHAPERAEIESVEVKVANAILGSCNIPTPKTALECKFSLRHAVAMVLADLDTASLGAYSVEIANRADMVVYRQMVIVDGQDWPGSDLMKATVAIKLTNGKILSASGDAGRPMADLNEQGRRLSAKAMKLVTPVLGEDKAQKLVARSLDFETTQDLLEVCV